MSIFLDNKYTNLYFKIIENRKALGIPASYYEKHHIIPRSLSNDDSKSNIICLTAREHFICHYLLCKMVALTPHRHKMIRAFNCMKACGSNQKRYFNSKLYSYARKNISQVMSEAQQGKNNSQYGTIWVTNFEEKISVRVDSNKIADYLNQGYIQKRVVNFDLIKKLRPKKRLKSRIFPSKYKDELTETELFWEKKTKLSKILSKDTTLEELEYKRKLIINMYEQEVPVNIIMSHLNISYSNPTVLLKSLGVKVFDMKKSVTISKGNK